MLKDFDSPEIVTRRHRLPRSVNGSLPSQKPMRLGYLEYVGGSHAIIPVLQDRALEIRGILADTPT